MKHFLLALFTILLPVALVAQSAPSSAVPLPKWNPPADTAYRELKAIYHNLLSRTQEEIMISQDYVADLANIGSQHISSPPFDPNLGLYMGPPSLDKSFSDFRPGYSEANFPNFPYSAIVRIEIYSPSGPLGFCSGIMIDKNMVISAGHCVHNPPVINGNISSIKVVPAYDNGSPYFGGYFAQGYYTLNQWVDNANLDYDITIIKLVENGGFDTGWMGWDASMDENDYTSPTAMFFTMGYPASSLFNEPAFDLGQRMWWTSGHYDFLGNQSTPGSINTVYHNDQAYKGLSGAGSFYVEDGKQYVVAVYSHGFQSVGGEIKVTGHARIDGLIGNFIQSLITGPTNNEVVKTPSLSVYPSPSENYIALKGKENSQGDFKILDISGRICKTGHWSGYQIDVTDLAPGIYNFELTTSEGILVSKFSKSVSH